MAEGKRRRVPVRDEVRHALIALLASEPNGIHAYELDRRLRVLSVGFWTPYSGEISRMLHQLEDDGDISSRWQMDDARPRRVFSAQQHGVERVDAWLGRAITAEPCPLHDKLWHRFVAHRARQRDPAEMLRDIRIRRASSLEQLRRLDEQLSATVGSESYSAFIRIALRIRQFEWQAELGILDELERELRVPAATSGPEVKSGNAIGRESAAADTATLPTQRRRSISGRKENALA